MVDESNYLFTQVRRQFLKIFGGATTGASLISVFLAFVFVGCASPPIPAKYYGTHPDPETIAVIYYYATTRGEKEARSAQASASLLRLTDVNGRAIKIELRTELPPGIYTLLSNWSYTYGPKSSEPYKITFTAKPGMTYSIDVESTLAKPIRLPKKLCLTEEAHNAEGAATFGVPVTEKYPFVRIPSAKAEKVSCGGFIEKLKLQTPL